MQEVTSIEGTTTSTKRVYVYLGDMLVGEILAGTPKIAYTWGPGGLVSQRDIGGSASKWYHFGPQGETRALTNGSGTVTDSYRYTAYGVPLSSSGSTYNPYRYGGKYGYYSEGLSGLIKAGARWYHPYTFRWTSRDPIKYRGGENLYAYVSGRPVFFVDPSGLAPFTNNSKDPVRIKPEHGDAFPPTFCPPGQTCDVDGVLDDPFDPLKIPNNCSCELNDGVLSVRCDLVGGFIDPRLWPWKFLPRRDSTLPNLQDWRPN